MRPFARKAELPAKLLGNLQAKRHTRNERAHVERAHLRARAEPRQRFVGNHTIELTEAPSRALPRRTIATKYPQVQVFARPHFVDDAKLAQHIRTPRYARQAQARRGPLPAQRAQHGRHQQGVAKATAAHYEHVVHAPRNELSPW